MVAVGTWSGLRGSAKSLADSSLNLRGSLNHDRGTRRVQSDVLPRGSSGLRPTVRPANICRLAGCSPLSFQIGKAAAGIEMIPPSIREARVLKERCFSLVPMEIDPEARQESAHLRAISRDTIPCHSLKDLGLPARSVRISWQSGQLACQNP